jgi:cell fate regulator YaaT (PSP1 superfamily)
MVCAVAFQPQGRLYYADPGDLTPQVGDHVRYPTDDGDEIAQVVWAPEWVADDIGGLPTLTGLASAQDEQDAETSRTRRAAARVAARRLVREHELPMKISGVDHVVATNHTTIYFSAPHRVDFRALVRDLSGTLKCRVELRQLSARDEARLTGGIGSCGRELCCSTFLVDFEPVSVRMAKDQDLPLNPLKISGACGRLMCCLKYEHPLYQEFNAKAPATGTAVETPAGDGVVVGHNVPSDTVVVRLAASGRRCACSRADVCSPRQQYEASPTTTPDARPVEPQPVEITAAPPVDEEPGEPAVEETPGGTRRKPRRRRRLSQAGDDQDTGDSSQ